MFSFSAHAAVFGIGAGILNGKKSDSIQAPKPIMVSLVSMNVGVKTDDRFQNNKKIVKPFVPENRGRWLFAFYSNVHCSNYLFSAPIICG